MECVFRTKIVTVFTKLLRSRVGLEIEVRVLDLSLPRARVHWWLNKSRVLDFPS